MPLSSSILLIFRPPDARHDADVDVDVGEEKKNEKAGWKRCRYRETERVEKRSLISESKIPKLVFVGIQTLVCSSEGKHVTSSQNNGSSLKAMVGSNSSRKTFFAKSALIMLVSAHAAQLSILFLLEKTVVLHLFVGPD